MTTTKTKQSAIEMSFEPLVLRTKHPFGISYGTTSDSTNVLVKLKYDKYEGLGEGSPVEYHNENPATALAVLKEWSESNLLGDNPFEIVEICKRMDKWIAGNFAAKSAIEMALHDLVGKIVGQPTWRLLGFENAKYPMTCFTIGIDSLDVIEKKTKEAVEAGFKMLKVKQGTDYDKEIIRSIRKHAPDLPLRVDANGGWTVKQAIRMSQYLAEQNVQFIEQPLPKHAQVEDFRIVREQSPVPIFADESICRSYDVARFAVAGAIDGIVVKLAKTGGLLEAIKVMHTARAHGLQIMFGCMIESSIGITAAAQLQSMCDYLDLDGAMLLANDPYSGAEYKDGYMVLPDRPGLGVVPR